LEALRLSPSVSMVLPRFAPEDGIEINGIRIPAKTELAANPYVIHRNKQIFGEDADEFQPERWFDSANAKLMRKYMFSFGYGSRRCLGKNIALFECQKFLLQLFRNFHIQYQFPERPCKIENWGILLYSEQFVILRAKKLLA